MDMSNANPTQTIFCQLALGYDCVGVCFGVCGGLQVIMLGPGWFLDTDMFVSVT